MAATPYADLPDHRFWRKAVAGVPPFAVDPIIDLPFQIHPQDKVATGGSCFAQHIAHRLQSSGLQYYQAETPPAGMSSAEAQTRGYGMYSCRYGNIYTTRQLLQLFDRAFGHFKPSLDWWQRPDGRYVDPFRPRIEPDGFATFETMDVFLFTFGLTESWVHREDGAVLQLAPGVAGGEWDESKYVFWNARASEVASDYLLFVDKLRAVNPDVRLIVSVSPVPIIATYMPRHALVSNSASKSTLRVACDEVVAQRPEIAYFPSYDLVSFGPNAARYYKDSLRELNGVGLSAVMRAFFDHFTAKEAKGNAVRALRIDVSREQAETTTVVCDEEAIEAA